MEKFLTNKNEMTGLEQIIVDQAKKRGIKIGIKMGLKKGMEKGLIRGLIEGIKKTKSELIKNLTARGSFSEGDIASFANVSVEFVREVRKKKNK